MLRSYALAVCLFLPASLFGQQKDLCGNPIPVHCGASDRECLKRIPRGVLKDDGGPTYRDWLDQDVRWIITDKERTAFKKLANDEERNTFIEMFWLRRDPTPNTIENEFEEEHYRRMMFANEHFSTSLPGWRSDRGRIYIMFGPPNAVAQGTKTIPEKGEVRDLPVETWHYTKVDGKPADLEFVDTDGSGNYEYALSREEKDALLYIPRHDRELDTASAGIQLYVGSVKWPEVRFKDLQEIITVKMHYAMLPFTVTTPFFRITDLTDWVPVTVQYNGKDVQWTKDGEVRRAKLHVLGRVTTLTQRVAQTFEDEINLTEPASSPLNKRYTDRSVLILPAGRYLLQLAIKDVTADRVGTWTKGILVGEYRDVSHMSSVILTNVPSDPVLDGGTNETSFAPTDPVYAFAQLYDATRFDPATARVDYEVFRNDGSKPDSVFRTTDNIKPASQVDLHQELFPGNWKPGNYDVVIKAHDADQLHEPICSITPFEVK